MKNNREAAPKLVITFPSTTAAMAMEDACREANCPGRLIPIPRELTAGCGLSWAAEPAAETRLMALLRDRGIPWGEARVLLLR